MSEKNTVATITGELADVIVDHATSRGVDEGEALKGMLSNYKFLSDAAFEGRNVVLVDPATSERQQVVL